MILDEIIKNKKEELEKTKELFPFTHLLSQITKANRDFKKAISKKGINLIAEIKKASPSKGVLRKKFNIVKVAKEYRFKNVAAVSVVTDKRFFKGNINFLRIAKKYSKKPILRKDFIIDDYQIYESRYFDADAVLLIASILTKEQIDDFISIAKQYNMECVVEIHTNEDLKKVLKTKAKIIGINNRNLENFKANLNTTVKLAKKIPKDRIIISESGFNTKADLKKVKKYVNAVLIGSSLMKSDDIKGKIRKLFE